MSKRVKSKYKINRRLGVNLWGRPKSSINKRDYPPGEHGLRRRKPSDLGTQLAPFWDLDHVIFIICSTHVPQWFIQ